MSIRAIDLLGNDISVGDTVVISHSGAQKLVAGEVLSISAKQCRIRCVVGCGVAQNFKSGERTRMPEITQRNHEHCVVIHSAATSKDDYLERVNCEDNGNIVTTENGKYVVTSCYEE